MTTLSVRITTDTKKQLETLARRARRSKSFLAAEAIAAFVEAESWQLDEIQAGLKELDGGRGVPHNVIPYRLRGDRLAMAEAPLVFRRPLDVIDDDDVNRLAHRFKLQAKLFLHR